MNNTSTFIQKNLNIFGFAKEVVKRWYLFVVSMVAFFAVAFIYSSFFMTPLYNSTAKLYMLTRQYENLSTSDFSISTYLTSDFSQIINDQVVLEDVAETLNNKYTAAQLKGLISINHPDGTRIIEVSVRTPNAKDSKLIVDSICDFSQEKIASIMGKDTVKILRYGEVAKAPSSPNIKRYSQLGLIIGFLFALAATFIIYIADNTISSEKDVEEYLGLSILATIPYNQNKLKPRA